MCVIVDNDVAARVLLRPEDPDFYPLHKALFRQRAPVLRMVYGGQLRDEYLKNHAIRGLLLELDRAGRLIAIADDRIEEEIRQLQKLRICCSNDFHVIAIARIAKVRLLASHDHDLQKDFKNYKLINSPRGKVFQTHRHSPLLRHGCSSIS